MKKGVLLVTSFLILTTLNSAFASNEIHLKSRRFSPPKGITNTAKAKIEATPGKAHVLIQLEKIPSIKQRKELENRGIRLLSYVPDNTWFASIPSDKTSEILSLANVGAVAEILPDDKIHPEIKKGNFLKHRVKDGKADLIVKFFKDVSLEEAELVIKKHKGHIVGRVPALNALVVTLEKEKSIDLGYEEAVMWIEQELPLEELNNGARIATGVEIVQGTPPNYTLDGSGVTVLVYDGGLVDNTHSDFGSRVTLGESGPTNWHATHVAGTVGSDGYMSDKQAQAGRDCTSCPELFPPGKTPKYVTVTFAAIDTCTAGCGGSNPFCEPPEGVYVLSQWSDCEWKYTVTDPPPGLGIYWKPAITQPSLVAQTSQGCKWFSYESSEICKKGSFANDINECDSTCGANGFGYVSWLPVSWPPGDSYQWRGMAPAVDIISYYVNGTCTWGDPNHNCLYDDSGQIADMNDNFNEGITIYDANIGTASVGAQPAIWGINCDFEGDYCSYSELIDTIIYKNLISITWAAGNERDLFYGRPCGEYRTISPTATVKNAIIVGATNSDNNNSMTDFSSWGPTDDGRIKPDLVAPGCQYEPVGQDDGTVSTMPGDTYAASCGTSMATPVVAGSISLMLQYWRQTHTGQPDLLPSTIKAILLQTAKDLGNTGPDYSFGYGLIDVNEAIKLIGIDTPDCNVILEDSIDDQNDEDYYLGVNVPAGANKLKITLVWDDYPAAPNPSRALVNNLDLVVKDPNELRYYPWTLDPNNPSNPAEANKSDHLNNVEQVEVNSPVSGLWRIKVSGPNVPEAPQKYSLVSNLALLECLAYDASDPNEYKDWVAWGRPECWCYRKQCRGDANGATLAHVRVTIADLNIFKSAYGKTAAALVGKSYNGVPLICADFTHKALANIRVTIADLSIFKTYYGRQEVYNANDICGATDVNVPCCDQTPDFNTGPYNFWTSPSQSGGEGLAGEQDVDIKALLEWLDELWLNGDLKEIMTEEEYLEFRKTVEESEF